MTDLQTILAVVFVVMAVLAAGLIAWGVSNLFEMSSSRTARDLPEERDPVAEMQRKNLAAKRDHNSQGR